tara:strand:+ start:396 stop:2717 length:2322 start_codon:yes stop_codon:yes gene_type:complete
MKNNYNDNDDFWADEIDDDVPSWDKDWYSGSVFGSQSTYLDDVDERQDIFSRYANFTEKISDTWVYKRQDKRRYSNMYDLDSHNILHSSLSDAHKQLDFSNTKETSYSLGKVANQTNGLDMRHNLLQKLSNSYEKYVAFALAMRTMPRFTDGLRLAKVSEKDHFDSTILKVTQEKYAKLFSTKETIRKHGGHFIPSILEETDKINYVTGKKSLENNYNVDFWHTSSTYNIHREWLHTLQNYRNNSWGTALDISLLPIFNASNRVAINCLMDFEKNVDKDFLRDLDNAEAPIVIDEYSIEGSDDRGQNTEVYQREINIDRKIDPFDNAYTRNKFELPSLYNASADKLPTDDEVLEMYAYHETQRNTRTNVFNLNQDDLKELYDLLMEHYNNNYSSIFISDINNSLNAVKHLHHCIQLSVDWQNIYQDFLKKKHQDSDSDDRFEDVYSQISMDSRKGAIMTPTMQRKLDKNAVDMIVDVEEETIKGRQSRNVAETDVNNNRIRSRSGFQQNHVKDTRVYDHDVPFMVIPEHDQVDSYQNAKINAILDHHKSVIGQKQKDKTGDITHKAWKMNFGDMKVFKRRPKTQAKVRVVIDCSGSMGKIDQEDSIIQKAFMINNGISKAFHDVETYLCAVDIHSVNHVARTGVARLSKGKMYRTEDNDTWSTHMSTPLCLGLQYIKDALEGSYDNSVCILITDGQPNYHIPLEHDKSCSCEHHSRDLSNELYQAGTRFGVINIGHQNTFAPSECVVNLSEYKTLDSEITKITELFNWLMTKK